MLRCYRAMLHGSNKLLKQSFSRVYILFKFLPNIPYIAITRNNVLFLQRWVEDEWKIFVDKDLPRREDCKTQYRFSNSLPYQRSS